MSDNPEYNAWAEKFQKKHGYMPQGKDILLYWEKNPEIFKQMCPHPARLDKENKKAKK